MALHCFAGPGGRAEEASSRLLEAEALGVLRCPEHQQQSYWNGKLGGYQPELAEQTAGFSAYQKPAVSEVEKFYWNDRVPGKQETKGPGEPNPARKAKLHGLREFENFNDEEKLSLFCSVPGLGGNNNPGVGPAGKQNNQETLHWAAATTSTSTANSQAALYRSYLQSYEASR